MRTFKTFILVFLVLIIESAFAARQIPAYKGKIINYSNVQTSTLKLYSSFICYYLDWSGVRRDCGSTVDAPVKLSPNGEYSVSRMTAGSSAPKGAGFYTYMKIGTPDAKVIYVYPNTSDPQMSSLFVLSIDPISIQLVKSDGSDAKEWIRRNMNYNSVLFRLAFSLVLPDGSVKELDDYTEFIDVDTRSVRDVIYIRPSIDYKPMLGAYVNPPAPPYMVQAVLSVRHDRDDTLLAEVKVVDKPNPNIMSMFPKVIRMDTK